jgi:hypothetical protein
MISCMPGMECLHCCLLGYAVYASLDRLTSDCLAAVLCCCSKSWRVLGCRSLA